MNQKNKLNRIYIPLMCAVIALSVALRTAAVLFDLDVRTGYFDAKGLINAASIIIVSGTVLLFTYAFVGAKKEKLIATFTTPSTYVPSGAIITALIFFAVKSFERIKNFNLTPSGAYDARDMIAYVTSNLASFVTAALVPLSLLAAVYFILNATVDKRASEARAAFGICTVILFALYASFLYFDTTLAINAPNKIVDQMAFIFASLFFLYEIRISLGRECWHLYMTFGFVAASLSAYSSIPSIILYLSSGSTVSHSIQENVLSLCVFIFVFARVILAGKLNVDCESEFVAVMRDAAREREKYITEKEEIERAAYLELYNRLKEIEEVSEDINENELFGIAKEDTEFEENEESVSAEEKTDSSEEDATSTEETSISDEEESPVSDEKNESAPDNESSDTTNEWSESINENAGTQEPEISPDKDSSESDEETDNKDSQDIFGEPSEEITENTAASISDLEEIVLDEDEKASDSDENN